MFVILPQQKSRGGHTLAAAPYIYNIRGSVLYYSDCKYGNLSKNGRKKTRGWQPAGLIATAKVRQDKRSRQTFHELFFKKNNAEIVKAL